MRSNTSESEYPKELEDSRPLIRAGVALLIYCAALAGGSSSCANAELLEPGAAHKAADYFIHTVIADLKAQKR